VSTALAGMFFIVMEMHCLTDPSISVRGPLSSDISSDIIESKRKLKHCKYSTLFLLSQIKRNVNVFVYEEIVREFIGSLPEETENMQP
jgi:hypothetical protein